MPKSIDPLTTMNKMGDDLPWGLTLRKPLVVMSLKATGFDPTVDRIIEIACVKLGVDGSQKDLFYQLNPQLHISSGATESHKVSDKHVKEWPILATVASELKAFLAGCDIAGYRLESFDLPLLICEFKRNGLEISLESVNLIDIGAIFNRFEPRLGLETAYRHLCRKELPASQSTIADAAAAANILLAQKRHYKSITTDMQTLHEFMHSKRPEALNRSAVAPGSSSTQRGLREDSAPPSSPISTRNRTGGSVPLDPEGKITWSNGEAIFTFGKHKGQAVEDVAEQNPSYLRWIAQRGNGFSAIVLDIVNAALQGDLPDTLEGFIAEFSLRI